MDQDRDGELPLGQLLLQLTKHWRRTQLKALEPYGLAAHQAHAFAAIVRWPERAGELRLSRLAERLRIAPRSATEVVDALEERGLVERHPSTSDRRATVIELTAAGRELAVEMRGGDRGPDPFAVLDADEQRELRGLLTRVLRATEESDPCGRAADGRPC